MDSAEPPDEPSDWFDRLLDEDFALAAEIHEPSAEERWARADRIRRQEMLQARLASNAVESTPEEYRYAPTELSSYDMPRSRRRTSWGKILISCFVVALIGYSIVATNRPDPPELREDLNFGGDRRATELFAGERPTPNVNDSTTPLGDTPPSPRGGGSFAFIDVQPGTSQPVTYDPCRPIPYVVNDSDAPDGATAMIERSIARLSEATGLVFVNEGATDESPSGGRAAFQRSRYGDRWAPVLIWWTNEDAAPDLEGDIAGFAGSQALRVTDQTGARTTSYVTGIVALDGPQFSEVINSRNGRAHAEAIILHELGHLVGLDHVEDATQLMAPVAGAMTDFGNGDLRGLYQLGQGQCVESL